MDLPKRPNFSEYEPRIYRQWEKKGYFTPRIDPPKKPFTILLPPPNANDPLHAGHAMYVIEDILARFHRMQGRPTLFLPGTDHAGIETQYVFEKKLAKKGRSRFDFDRKTLYQMISDYVEENRGIAKQQLRRLGFSLDWTREKYTLEPQILAIVFDTFRQLRTDGLIYRDQRLVNYCTHCGTGFSSLEIDHQEQTDPLYFLDYGSVQIATTRPETIFADAAVAVNPNWGPHKNLIGQTAVIPIINKEIPIIGDAAVDPEFGTGALKITPGHDPLDYEIGQRHQLARVSVINRRGEMINVPRDYLGLGVGKAREKTVQQLAKLQRLVKKEPLTRSVGICYRCKNILEPLLLPQWYLRVKPLIDPVIRAVENHKVKLFPPRFKKELLRWLQTAPDWNISRQIVWGPRIPAWYCAECSPEIEVTFLDSQEKAVSGKIGQLLKHHDYDQIQGGLQSLIAPVDAKYQLTDQVCEQCSGNHLLQETDTFDTWFSSGQWPFTTLGFAKRGSSAKCKVQSAKISDFDYFYPTSVLDTMWDILPFWVMRMLMLGIYRTGTVPFEWVHLHSRVVDAQGKKMSKSLGNVINPLEMAEKYGADALRFALVFGTAPASDIPLGEEKLAGARNFVTKLWNIARFILGQNNSSGTTVKSLKLKENKELISQLNQLIKEVSENIEGFRFSQALDKLYNFTWNEFASAYLEEFKSRSNDPESIYVLHFTLCTLLKLLHPFMPFVTEEIYQKLPNKDAQSLIIAPWPKLNQDHTNDQSK